MSKLAVLILAAGNASRMGFPKQLLKWKDTNLLQHAIDSVKDLNGDVVFLILGAHYEKIISEIDTNNITVLQNDHWKEGLGKSIAFGMNHINQSNLEIDHVLIVLADQPLIDIDYLKSLLEAYSKSKHKITCTLYHEDKFGVPAIFDKIYFKELSQLNHDKGAKRLLEKHRDSLSYVNGENVIVDIDTIDDYEKLYKIHH